MKINRRDFVKSCAAAGVLLVPGIVSVAAAQDKMVSSDTALGIEKSIKASFGGGFSLRTHVQAHGLTYADIAHCGNRYTVSSADLLDWDILGQH
ncbi:twin-arginine translocation signal domain-containing protein [Pollutimonas thiosulfatoxidans]|uniref:Twin-arginine translocation pathway signal protein n=1 Tax=Pollutimonas thiosulfatoxidans TaxID=2028345 RepID=A0A410GA91_9BURK|nr:twin-arginine translocation signal domain-containing protein [Pollutimonas thiosulfatoxidans]QAA93223.1 twin-arginine translocation pathway signal protein [Pollutimonas thiosulfatoxidans]